MAAAEKLEQIEVLHKMQELMDKIEDLDYEEKKIYEQAENVDPNPDPYTDLYETGNWLDVEDEEKEAEKAAETSRNAAKAAKKKMVLIGSVCITLVLGVVLYFCALIEGFIDVAIVVGIGFLLYFIWNKIAQAAVEAVYEKELKNIHDKYKLIIQEAKIKDDKEWARYEADKKALQDAEVASHKAELDEIAKKRNAVQAELNEISLLSKKDLAENPGLVAEVLDLMESNRADSVKEALKELADIARAEEAARLAAEERERARKAAMPGRLKISVGREGSSYSNRREVSNSVYVDGVVLGAASWDGTEFLLNPGPHVVFVKVQWNDTIYNSPSRSFNLPGDGEISMTSRFDGHNPSLIINY